MNNSAPYSPGPAVGAVVQKDGDRWTLAIVRELRHSPENVWQALTEPDELKEWSPFDADKNLGQTGVTVKLTTVGAPGQNPAETTVTQAIPPKLLIFKWGDNDVRWELEPQGSGTRLSLWTNIPKNFVSMGAAGWHICLDVLDLYLSETPVGRRVGMELMQDEGWQRLNREYAAQFGVEPPQW